MKTKQRILREARLLFNDQGYAHVKITDIAENVAISPGNLWYHFKSRQDILEAICNEFMVSAGERMKVRPGNSNIVNEFAEFIDILTQEVSSFRFLYRDQADYGEYPEDTLQALPAVFSGTLEQYSVFIEEMRNQGKMAIKNTEINMLSQVLCTIMRFSEEYIRESTMAIGRYQESELHAVTLKCFTLNRFMTDEIFQQFKAYLFSLIQKRHLTDSK